MPIVPTVGGLAYFWVGCWQLRVKDDFKAQHNNFQWEGVAGQDDVQAACACLSSPRSKLTFPMAARCRFSRSPRWWMKPSPTNWITGTPTPISSRVFRPRPARHRRRADRRQVRGADRLGRTCIVCEARGGGGAASSSLRDCRHGPDVAESLLHAFAAALDCWRLRCCLRRRSRSMDARSTRLIRV
jgi:hypothetical protein